METPSSNPNKAHQSNFYYSFLFLPEDQKQAILKIYGFCRIVDDVADSSLPDNEKLRRIEEWKTELTRCFEGHPHHPIMKALWGAIQTFGLSRNYFEDLVRGVEMDITINRYKTFDELSRYCYHVAGTVGLLCLQVFGLSSDRYRNYASHLATAFQLTNILRDLKHDANLGRIYLPLEDLETFNYSEEEFFNGVYNDRFINLMKFQVKRAEGFYSMTQSLILNKDRKKLIASEIMSVIYASLLKGIISIKFDVFSHQVTLSTLQKMTLALRTRLSMILPSARPRPL